MPKTAITLPSSPSSASRRADLGARREPLRPMASVRARGTTLTQEFSSVKATHIVCMLLCLAGAGFCQWEPMFDLCGSNSGGSYTSSVNGAFCVAATGDTVHAVWVWLSSVGNGVIYRRSVDAGATWLAQARLAERGVSACLAVDGLVVYLLYAARRDTLIEFYLRRSSDGGASWSGEDTILSAPRFFVNPVLATGCGWVHLVWELYRESILYKRSSDGGVTWSADLELCGGGCQPGSPTVLTSDSDVHAAWYDFRASNLEIYHRRSADSGATWGADSRVCTDTVMSVDPALAVQDSVVSAVWLQRLNGIFQVCYGRSPDKGRTWEPPRRISVGAFHAADPVVAASGRNVHVAWAEFRPELELHYIRSTDEGLTWEDPTRLTTDAVSDCQPFISAGGSSVHVIWQRRVQDEHVCYLRSPLGNSALDGRPWPSIVEAHPRASSIIRGSLLLPFSLLTAHF